MKDNEIENIVKNKDLVLYLIRKSNQGCDGAKDILNIFRDKILDEYPGVSTDGFWWFWNGKCIGGLSVDNSGVFYEEFEHGILKG